MFRSIKGILAFSCALYAWPSLAMPARPTAIILATNPNNPSATSVEFYQDVIRYIDTTKTWIRMPHDVIVGQLQRAGYHTTLGSIPVISPNTIKKANQTEKKTVIPQIQVVLDSLAIPTSIIVSCQEQAANKVKGCSLFYYDRNKQKIIASVDKSFAIPVHDVTRWAPVMVNTLASGIEAAERKQDQEAFDSLLAKSEGDNKNRYLLNLAMLGEQTGVSGSNWSTMPQAFVSAQYLKDNQAFGLEASYGRRSGSLEQESAVMQARAVGLSLNYSSQALDSLIWDFGLGLGYKERIMSLTDLEQNKKDGSVYLSLRPGLYCRATKAISLGLSGHFTSYMNIANTEDDRLTNEDLKRFAMGLSVGLRAEF